MNTKNGNARKYCFERVEWTVTLPEIRISAEDSARLQTSKPRFKEAKNVTKNNLKIHQVKYNR